MTKDNKFIFKRFFVRMVQAPPVFEDDPELIDKALAAVRKTFNTGKTKPLDYRLA